MSWPHTIGLYDMQAKRHLLSEDVVKLQEFQQRKLAVAHQVSGSKSHYIEVFNQKLMKKQLVLKDELKLLLHLCQSAEDMVTARGAIYRYHEENRNVAFGEFKFGPLFMRLCYELGLEEMAAATLTDKDLRGFFSDSTSFNIAIDMLFMKGLYESGLDVLRDMKNQGVPFNKDTFTLATGTCYKLNTPESYRICTALMEEGQTKGHMIPRHAYCFTVALALRQNDVEKAQSMFGQIMSTDSRICQNLKVLILAMAGAVKESLFILTLALGSSTTVFIKKPEFAQEVVDLVRLRSEDSPLMAGVEEAVSRLQNAGQVTQRSLDEMLCHTPTGKRRMPIGMMEERLISRRTLRPLQSTLLSE
ncbi:pentatricopeptide repeat-containing protein 2, mitochondrial isoform X2 [Oncorhynchus nerka]|uniref:pentatricopeptide repeat-containing protein 2, mitochondrial isoform X2 n=2 Tax=Oncorhynchus TaxID=8016 RepID=UPI00099FBAF8|nr:pentatricopeptide repeat-containing protein 2, mitochondrial isoform X2 [Oncorhynchus kisutch]XP_021446257.2 pentatricopeptide repeat-containing protein 2, mitochondrial isoform X2 [Oncorhynchus mykiss]XP_029544848.1 pentatricopeptide repeat-containing protein 2, mitochondrial isoform X2 [Oncorhynchus nerka]XP_046173523.1 pentatricopeptide repeat-containing protein 2, mitochondrial isoform X2 [Oncorhynchus gorbuscha]